jgi:hypothetical protein
MHMTFFRKTVLSLCVSLALASPASAFINPRAFATVTPDFQYPGYGILRIEVAGGAWRCAGRVKYEDGRAMEQTVGLECVGWAKSATATIRPEGEFRYKVNYRLSNGIKGHLSLIR